MGRATQLSQLYAFFRSLKTNEHALMGVLAMVPQQLATEQHRIPGAHRAGLIRLSLTTSIATRPWCNSPTARSSATSSPSAAPGSPVDRSHELSEEELEALAAEIASGARGFHQLPRGLDPVQAAWVRRRAVARRARKSGQDLDLGHIGSFTLDAARASTQNCENFAGAAQIPLGLVGPLRVKGSDPQKG